MLSPKISYPFLGVRKAFNCVRNRLWVFCRIKKMADEFMKFLRCRKGELDMSVEPAPNCTINRIRRVRCRNDDAVRYGVVELLQQRDYNSIQLADITCASSCASNCVKFIK